MIDKSAIIELQKIDCNCNNCKHMIRDLTAFEKWRVFHYDMQQKMFGARKAKAIDDAIALVSSNPTELSIKKAYDFLLQKAWNMEFIFEKNRVNYGDCSKFNKPVSFIPDTCQIDTQHCFDHRKN